MILSGRMKQKRLEIKAKRLAIVSGLHNKFRV
jgi:hypothetical protein